MQFKKFLLGFIPVLFMSACATLVPNEVDTSSSNSSDSSEHTHSYDSVWSSDETYHWHASTCGHDDKDKEAHAFVETVTDPTYEAEGNISYVCSICSYTKNTKLNKLEHHYASEWSYDQTSHWHACTDPGYEHLRSDEISHTFNDVVTEPTFESLGYTTHTCSICSYSYKDSETNKKEHQFSEWKYDDTSHWKVCLDQGYENLKTEVGNHDFHEWASGEVSDEGKLIKTRSCNVCKKVEQEVISYTVSEEVFTNAFKSMNNFTCESKYEDEYNNYSFFRIYIDKEYCKSYSLSSSSSSTYEAEYIMEYNDDGYYAYIYDENFDIIEKQELISPAFLGYDNFQDYIYHYLNFNVLVENFSSFTFDKNKLSLTCESLTFTNAMVGLTFTVSDIEISFYNNQLKSIKYASQEGSYRVSIYDIGTTTIDLSIISSAHTHTFDANVWEYSKYAHWHPMTCEHKGMEDKYNSYTSTSGRSSHDFEDGVCTVCGYACPHEKTYDMDDNSTICHDCNFVHEHSALVDTYYPYDDNTHYQKYECGHMYKASLTSHNFEDCVCTDCGYIKHEYEYKYTFDEEYHWNEMYCSHKDQIENATKEKHNFEKYGEWCETCKCMKKATTAGEEVSAEVWKETFDSIDTSNVTFITYSSSSFARGKLLCNNNNYNLITDYYLEAGAYSYENNKYYVTEENDNGEIIKRELFSNENSALNDYLNKLKILELLKELNFDDFTFGEDGLYTLNSDYTDILISEDSNEEDNYISINKIGVKFKDDKLDFIFNSPWSDIESAFKYEFTYFYDFNETHVDVPKTTKTYNLTGEYQVLENDIYSADLSHSPIYECDDERIIFSKFKSSHYYFKNNDGEYICALCQHVCQHTNFYGAKCASCEYIHTHVADENNVCTICKTTITDYLLLNDLFQYILPEVDSFTVTADGYYKNEQGETAITYVCSCFEGGYYEKDFDGSESWYLISQDNKSSSLYSLSTNEDGTSSWLKTDYSSVDYDFSSTLRYNLNFFYNNWRKFIIGENNTYVLPDFDNYYNIVIQCDENNNVISASVEYKESDEEHGVEAYIKYTFTFNCQITIPDFGC